MGICCSHDVPPLLLHDQHHRHRHASAGRFRRGERAHRHELVCRQLLDPSRRHRLHSCWWTQGHFLGQLHPFRCRYVPPPQTTCISAFACSWRWWCLHHFNWASSSPSPHVCGTATFAAVHVVLVIFVYLVYVASPKLGSPKDVYQKLSAVASGSRVCTEPINHHGQACGPVSGNNGGSYLTMLSTGGLVFGIINIVGNFGTVFVDNVSRASTHDILQYCSSSDRQLLAVSLESYKTCCASRSPWSALRLDQHLLCCTQKCFW